MSITLQRTEITGVEPITLSEMKNHLRVDFDDDDDLISSLIMAARERAENITGRTIVNSSWVYCIDCFPYEWYTDKAPARNTPTRVMDWWANAQIIRLPKSPLIEVTSVQYIPDDSGAYVTLDPSFYTADNTSQPPTLYPINNLYWPTIWAIHNAVKISFTAGYDTACPEGIKVAIRLMVAYWYENRCDAVAVPKVAEYLLTNHRSQPCGYITD